MLAKEIIEKCVKKEYQGRAYLNAHIPEVDSWWHVHMDEEAAKQSIYGGLTAPGVLTQCIAVKLISQSLPPSAVIGIVGKDEVKFPVAVRPDMRLHIEAETISKRPSSKPGRGLVQTRFKLLTHDGLEVYSALHIVLFETRPDGAFS